MSALVLVARPISRTSCFRRCATSLAGIWKKRPMRDPDSHERTQIRRIGVFRRNRRSRLQEDLSVATGHAETGPPRCARHRRRKGRLDTRPAKGRVRDSLEKHGGLDAAAFDKLAGLLRYV